MNNKYIKCPYCEEEIDSESIRCEYCDELIKNDYKIVSNIIINNYFHILWLDISSDQKQISKRAKDILKYLAIWETPEFDNDFDFTKDYRNEIYVKWALDNLSKPKEKLINTFFWFDIESDEDKKIFTLINNNEFDKVIELAKKSWNKKNLALIYSINLLEPNITINYKELVEESVKLYKDISEDDKFWKMFEKKYFLYDDLSTNKELISELRKELWKYLSNLYYDISSKIWDDTVLKVFHKYFKNSQWNKTNEEVEKIYLELNRFAWELKEMNISDDGIFDDDEKNNIKKIHKNIILLLKKLEDLWLYDDSKTLLVRDIVTDAFRTIMLDLNNELNEEWEALKILNYALDIVGTDWLKHKINEDYKTITANIKLKPVIQLLDIEDFSWASKKIDELENEDLNNEDKRFIKNLKKRAILWRLWKWFIEGKKFFEKEKYIDSWNYFIAVKNLAEKNIELYDWINLEQFNIFLDLVNNYLNKIDKWEKSAKDVFDYIDEIRSKTLENLSENDWYFFMFYIDSIIYWYLSKAIPNTKKTNWWSWWWWFIFIWIIILISIFNDDNSSSNNYDSNSNYNSTNYDYSLGDYRCGSYSYKRAWELMPIDPWFQIMIDELTKLESEYKNIYVDEYSQISIDNYNRKIDNYNRKFDSYELARTNYNNKIDIYNKYLEDNCTKK